MTEIPTPENFLELSLVADKFVEQASRAIVFELDKLPGARHTDSSLAETAIACAKLLEEKYNEVLSAECKRTIEWFEAEPAFAMAFKSLSYVKVSENHWEGPILRELERWRANVRLDRGPHAGSMALKIARVPCHYLTYLSLVAGASYRYVSGIGHRAVIEGPSTIRRLKDLISELEDVLGAEWLPDDLRKNLGYSLRTGAALRDLNTHDENVFTPSRRNDIDLPARLFATDLLRIHQQIFQSFHKKSVFHLMGLSFVSRPLEMRTIERLAKSEMDAHREVVAKRIADRRGLDFEHVLTTLKANKSLTFPSQNQG